MRILFTTYPEKTHFLAMAPLAWALRTAGHEVRFAVQPPFVDTVTQAGLTAVPVGGNRHLWQLMDRDPLWLTSGMNGILIPYDSADWRPSEVTYGYLRDGYDIQVKRWHQVSNGPMVADLVAYARHWQPDLIVWEATTHAGAIAARACGAAHARLLFTIDTFGVTRENFLRLAAEEPAGQRADPLGEWLAGYARGHGFDYGEDLVTGQFTIELPPPSLRLRADNLRYVPMRYVPYGGAATVPAWLWERPARPRIGLTLGLSMYEHGGNYGVNLPEVLQSLSSLDVEVVATVGGSIRDDAPPLPDNVRLVSYVPLEALASTCSVMIHHAGYGTLATTTLAGVPQVMVTFDSDGPALARRVAAQGAGLAVHLTQAAGRVFRDRVERILTESRFREAAGRLRAEMLAMPSPNELVGDLEKLILEHRRSPAGAAA